MDNDIHKTVADALEDDMGAEMLYKGKPRANVYIGDGKAIGYIYRVKIEIENKFATFDAWVDIKKVDDYPIKELI